MAEKGRWEELERSEKIRKEYPLAYPISSVRLLVVIIRLLVGMVIYADHDVWGYGINVFTTWSVPLRPC